MYALYSVFLYFFRIILGVLSLFDQKIRRGIEGRKNLFQVVESHYSKLNPLRKRILIHVSSFGELEQAKPVISALRSRYPDSHIHLTCFSPSGYENAINSYDEPDLITYLPFDSQSHVKWFLDLVKPHLVLFVRYDLWHNFVHECHDRNIPMLLFSATFDSSFTKSLPLIISLYRNTYSFIHTICTVSEQDKVSIETFAVHSRDILVAGDTRFDQVLARKQLIAELPSNFLPEKILQKIRTENLKVIVCGSIWERDDEIILPSIRKAISAGEKIIAILVPHEVHQSRMETLFKILGKEAIRLSDVGNYRQEQIIVVDTIGKLFELYRYASIAYIGGGFGAGVHNVLEPAVWGVPSIVGPNHHRSKEIASFIGGGAIVEIQSAREFEEAFGHWFVTDMSRNVAAAAAQDIVAASEGATAKVMDKITGLNW